MQRKQAVMGQAPFRIGFILEQVAFCNAMNTFVSYLKSYFLSFIITDGLVSFLIGLLVIF